MRWPPASFVIALIALFMTGAGASAQQAQQSDIVLAARRGDIEKVKELLKSGGTVNTRDPNGRTALHEAAASENVELFKLLVLAGGDIHAKDNQGVTPEFIVRHIRIFGVSVAMMRAFPKRSLPAAQEGPWTLASAIAHRQPGIVEMLLKLGVDANAVDDDGNSPLGLAAQKGDPEIVRMLLSHGAGVSSPNKAGALPIHTAALSGNTEVVKSLLDQGVDIDCRVLGSGETPL